MTAEKTAYRPRYLDAALAQDLRAAGGVVTEGACGSGKTMSALNTAASSVFLDAPEIRHLLEVAPEILLDGARPRLLEEWQLAPDLRNMVRREVDRAREPGQFLLTGSPPPSDDISRHSGAGRFVCIRLDLLVP